MRLLHVLVLLVSFLIAATAAVDELPAVVYVPYDQVPAAGPQGQGVFLPYEKFIKLWDAANPKPPDAKPDEPPIGAALSGFTLVGRVQGDSAELVLDGTITALAKGWSRVELPAALALSDFKPADKRVVLERVGEAGSGDGKPDARARRAVLVVHLPEPGTYRFTASLAVPVVRDAAGKRTVALALPVAAAGRLDLLIADTEAEVALAPLVAATTTKEKAGTHLLAVLGGAPRLSVTWQPPVQEAAGEALLLAAGDLRVTVAERSLRYDLAERVTVLRRPVQQFAIAIPPGTQVLAVEAKGLRTWEKTGDAASGEKLIVHLHEAVEGDIALGLHFERLLPPLPPGESRPVNVPWPSLDGASRATGTVAVLQGEGLAVAVEHADGLAQTDPGEVPDGQGAVAAFRFLAVPPPATLTVTRLQSEVRAAIHQLVRLGVEEDLIGVVAQLEVRKAGIFALTCEAPAAWELVDTSGLAVDDVRAGKPDGATRRYELALRGRLLGAGELVLRFKAPPSIPREAKPGAAPTAVAVAVLQLSEARQVRGTLAVAAPRSWALSTAERTGLSGAEVESLRHDGALAVLARELKDDEDLPLGFTFLGNGAAVRLAAAPRSRELAVTVEELITAAEGGLRRVATLRGEVRYSPAAALRVQAPSALDDKLVFKGTNLAEHAAVAHDHGLTTWELRFQSPVLGAFVATIEQASDVPALVAGTPAKLTVEPLLVLDTTRLRYLGAVAREGTVEVDASAPGLDAVTPADLPTGLQGQGVVAGFQGASAVAVTLTLVRHDLVALADGAVAGARWLAVIGEDGVARCRGDLLLASRGRPYLDVRMPAGAELLEVAVDGRQGRPSRRADGSVVVPLGDAGGLRSQRIALVYEQRLGEHLGTLGGVAVALPRLGSDAGPDGGGARPLPVGRVELQVYVPETLAAYGWSGDFQPSAPPEELWGRLLHQVAGANDDANSQQQAEPVPPPSDDGLTVRVAAVGTPHALQRLGDGGGVSFHYAGRGLLDGLALVLALAGVLAVWLLRRRGEAVAALAGSALALVLAVGGVWLEVVAGFALGTAVAIAVLLGVWMFRALRAWRRREPDITPDPWLDTVGGAPLPSASPQTAAPSTTTAVPTGNTGSVQDDVAPKPPSDQEPRP